MPLLFKLFSLFLLSLTFSWTAEVASPLNLKGSTENGKTLKNLLIDATGADYAIRLEGVKNLTIEDCVLKNFKLSGVMLKGCESIKIKRCTIYGNGERGIQLSSTGGNQDILIQDCEIYGVMIDGIYSGDVKGQELQQPGLVISRNYIHHVSSNDTWAGHFHGMYIQSPDAVIEDNLVTDVFDGNGISMRSSGVVRGNQIFRVGKGGIAYFNDHKSGPGQTLVIENNLVHTVSLNPKVTKTTCLVVLDPPKDAPSPRVETFKGKNNQVQDNNASYLSSSWNPKSFEGLEISASLKIQPKERDPRVLH